MSADETLIMLTADIVAANVSKTAWQSTISLH